MLGMLFVVDSWIAAPVQPEAPSAATAALIAIARHGDRTLQPEFATSEERPVPKAAPDSPSPKFADPAASDHPARGASDFKRVSDARAEMIVAEKDTSRPRGC